MRRAMWDQSDAGGVARMYWGQYTGLEKKSVFMLPGGYSGLQSTPPDRKPNFKSNVSAARGRDWCADHGRNDGRTGNGFEN